MENRFVRFAKEPDLFVVTVSDLEPTDEEWEFTKNGILGRYAEALRERSRFALVFDFRNMALPSPERLQDFVDLFRRNTNATAACVVCTAIVTDSVMARAAINMFFSVYSSVRPVRLVSSVEEAREWCRESSSSQQ